MQKMYKIEEESKYLITKDKKQKRQQKPVPILQFLYKGIKKQYMESRPRQNDIVKGSAIREVICPILKRWDRLSRYSVIDSVKGLEEVYFKSNQIQSTNL